MAKLSLSAEEWLALYKAIDSVPEKARTPELAQVQKDIRSLLETVVTMRDQIGDPRGLFEVTCPVCKNPILEREQDYFVEHEMGNYYHAPCWLKR